MFGIFRSLSIEDPVLGTLKRHGRSWEGTICLAGFEDIPIELDGSKQEPVAEALVAARELPARLPTLLPEIESALLEHFEPYRDAMKDPEYLQVFVEDIPDPQVRKQISSISTAKDAWAATQIVGVEIGPEQGKVRVLIKLGTLWDVEHTLGAYFDDWEFLELNGSV